MDIAGRSALVTGATGGIGRAIARELARRGAALVVTGRNTEVLDRLAAELGGRAVVADLADRREVERLADVAGAVDIFVSNAALPASGDLSDFSVEELDRALDVNLRAPIVLARALSAGMVARGEGQIVIVSSMAGKLPPQGLSLYSATKAGLRAFALVLRQDLAGAGVGVSVLVPGPIRDAGMWADTGLPLPLGVHTRSPDDVAGAVVQAVTTNTVEIDVAPVPLRVGGALAPLAPAAVLRAMHLLGADRYASEMAARQRHKR